MKRTLMDKVVGFFSPTAELRRSQAKFALERGYDAAKTFKTDDWTSAKASGVNSETAAALPLLRDRARDATRNNPIAAHGLDVVVNNTIGTGIVPKITGTSDAETQKVRAAYREWAETTMCDADGRLNYYALQYLAFRSMFESGEGLAKRVYTSNGPAIQLLESDFIDSTKDSGKVTQGIERSNGVRTAYYLHSAHPSEVGNTTSKRVPADQVIHMFDVQRPGQMRGVSKLHAVINYLEDLKEFLRVTLIKKKVSACFGMFITSDNDDLSTNIQKKSRRELDSALEPAMIRYLNRGENAVFANPPGEDGNAEFIRTLFRKIAAGFGITYEALTNDYSQVNYSSARMAHLEMRKNIEAWRWNIMIPQFCEPTFKIFLQYAQIKYGIKPENITVRWTPPTFAMIDPTKEISALQTEVRSGFKSLDEAIRENGYEPSEVFAQIEATNKELDARGVALDTDPRKMTKIGFAQAPEAISTLTGSDTTGDTTNGTEN